MEFNQGSFDFDSPGDETGYRKWQEELDARKKRFETRYGIILGSRVRLTLIGENTPLEGIITLCDSNEPAIRSRLHLRMGKREFILAEIESVMRL